MSLRAIAESPKAQSLQRSDEPSGRPCRLPCTHADVRTAPLSAAFIPIPSLHDAESQRLDAHMTALAQEMAAVEGVAEFATTGWLPDRFFALLAQVYALYDHFIEHNIGASELKIQCKVGCSRCCRQVVQGTYSFEIIHLYRQLRELPQYPQVHDAFLKHANAFQDLLAGFRQRPANASASDEDAECFALRSYAAANLWCPLLVENACSIYANRPVPCRMYHSLTDPILCVTPIGHTFNIEPPAAANRVLTALSDRLAFPYSHSLAQGLVAFAAMRGFRPWSPPRRAP